MAIIYLIRHGEAAASWQENPDPGLSERGLSQADAVANELRAAPIDSILSSPLLRARETAAPLAVALGLSCETADVFREIPTPPNVSLEHRLAWLRSCVNKTWAETDVSLQQWRSEILQALAAVTVNTAVFTHFMVMNAVLGQLEAQSTLVCYQPDYCSVLTLESAAGSLHLLSAGRQASSRIL